MQKTRKLLIVPHDQIAPSAQTCDALEVSGPLPTILDDDGRLLHLGLKLSVSASSESQIDTRVRW